MARASVKATVVQLRESQYGYFVTLDPGTTQPFELGISGALADDLATTINGETQVRITLTLLPPKSDA